MNHLKCMDDIKICAQNEEFEIPIQNIRIYSQDIGMEFERKKKNNWRNKTAQSRKQQNIWKKKIIYT